MIGRTALALLIESKRDEEDPRVPPFNWGAVGFPREETPDLGRLSLPSVRSNSLSVGSFSAASPTKSSFAETQRRLLARKVSGRDDTETVLRARKWFAPHLVGNPAARARPYRYPGLAPAARSPPPPAHDTARPAPAFALAASTVASRARSVPGAKFLDDDDDADDGGGAAAVGPEVDGGGRQTYKPPSRADFRALARVAQPSEDVALLGAAFLTLVHPGATLPDDLKWATFAAAARDADLRAAAKAVHRVDDAKRRALHAFLDGRLHADVAKFTKRQGLAVRKLERWIRATLAAADYAIANLYGPCAPARPKSPPNNHLVNPDENHD